jgi:hypothetical protein
VTFPVPDIKSDTLMPPIERDTRKSSQEKSQDGTIRETEMNYPILREIRSKGKNL